METIVIEKDINVFYITADSYPDGIMDAHKKLHALVPFSPDRKYFGVSRPENSVIVYRAATEERFPGEAEQFKCDTLILKGGNYLCITIQNYQQDIPAIRKAFNKLLLNQQLDPKGYCVEWYFNATDVRCMVRLRD